MKSRSLGTSIMRHVCITFNPRAEKAYLKAGFKKEGVLRDAVMDGEKYADDILMAMLEDDWRKIKKLER